MKAKDILDKNQNYAIIGMRPKEGCFACKIYRLLEENGKTVYGLNPNYDEAIGVKLYDDLDDLDKEIDVAVFVINPKIGIHMLKDVKKHKIKELWLQPGTVNDALLEKAKELDLKVTEDCVLAVYARHEEEIADEIKSPPYI